MDINKSIQKAFESVIKSAYRVSKDVGGLVEEVLKEGRENPLDHNEAARLLKQVVSVLRQKAGKRGDKAACKSLEGDINDIVKHWVQERKSTTGTTKHGRGREGGQTQKRFTLVERNGIRPGPVFPQPVFQGRGVPMSGGFVKTTDIRLWDENVRLEIHLSQFEENHGRRPTSEEVLDIMLSKMELPGISDVPGLSKGAKKDQFNIVELAWSIAANGVQKPPIFDRQGNPLDGNRRIAACYYILNSDDFDSEQKKRAEYIYSWEVSEHATEDDERAVVVSLNFAPDCKEPWPEYVKARKVYEEWQAMLALEPRTPGSQRQNQLKRELSMKFALGPEAASVTRYLKMVDWVIDFEDYHINEKGNETFAVKHRANRYFQYFDELAKGITSGGVAHSLNQDESFKHCVFDLLFDGKFKNWRQIRELKLIYDNEEAREALEKARAATDIEVADDHLENALAIARSRRAEAREVGANTRIESFVKFLEELPVRAFRDVITRENLRRLQRALKLVDRQATEILKEGKS